MLDFIAFVVGALIATLPWIAYSSFMFIRVGFIIFDVVFAAIALRIGVFDNGWFWCGVIVCSIGGYAHHWVRNSLLIRDAERPVRTRENHERI